MVEIYAIRIDEPIEEDEYKKLLSFASEEKRDRIKNFHFVEDAKRTLYGELLIRYLACKRLETTNRELVIACNAFGKPFLIGYPSFQFNISHSGDWVVCAISQKEVGIDIEKIESVDYDIAKRFFSNNEYKSLMMQEKKLQLAYFYDLWTLKESYIKYMGKGLSIPLNSFSINIHKEAIEILPDSIQSIYFSRVFLDQKYKLSVCAKNDISQSAIQANLINIKNFKEVLINE